MVTMVTHVAEHTGNGRDDIYQKGLISSKVAVETLSFAENSSTQIMHVGACGCMMSRHITNGSTLLKACSSRSFIPIQEY